MALPLWLRARTHQLIQNYLTPLLCAAGVAAYSAATAQWPEVVAVVREAGLDPIAVNGAIVAAMAFLSNMIDRFWSAPVLQPAMTEKEAVAEVRTSKD